MLIIMNINLQAEILMMVKEEIAVIVGEYVGGYNWLDVRCKTCSSITGSGFAIICAINDCTNCGGAYVEFGNMAYNSYHGICSDCNGKGYKLDKTNCTICNGKGTVNCTNCDGRGYLLDPYSCAHGRSGGSSHYYCSTSSNHGNIVNQYH